MLLYMGIILSIVIGFIYNLLVGQISDMLTKDDQMNDKIGTKLIIDIICGIGAMAVGYLFFNTGPLANKVAKWGLYFGGAALLVCSFVCNWSTVGDSIKLLCIGGALLGAVVYSYKFLKKDDASTKKKIK